MSAIDWVLLAIVAARGPMAGLAGGAGVRAGRAMDARLVAGMGGDTGGVRRRRGGGANDAGLAGVGRD